MPGLVGFASTKSHDEQTLTNMQSELSCPVEYQSTQYKSALGQFANYHLGFFDHSIVAKTPDGSVGLLLDGWIWNLSELSTIAADAAQYCLDSYIEIGTEFVKKLNGEFNLVISDQQTGTVTVLNDRFGLRPLQYAVYAGSLFISTEAKAILAGSGLSAKLDQEMVLNFLSVGRAYLGDRTFFEGVRVLPAASVFSWKDGKITHTNYWDYVYRPRRVIDDEFIEELASSFTAGVKRRIKPNLRYAITLSGGLDSRVVASVLGPETNNKALGFSFGSHDCDEVSIAQSVAQKINIPWKFKELVPNDYIEHASEGIRITEGLDIFVQSYGMTVYPELCKEADIAFTGLGLDVTLGGTYIDPQLLEAGLTTEQVLAVIEKKLCYFDAYMVENLFGSKKHAQRASDLLRQAFQPDDTQSIIDQADRFALHHRGSRMLFMRQTWQRLYLEDASPTFDTNFIDLILQIPAKDRLGHRVYQRFMQQLCPHLMDIPYQRTLLPPSVPIEFWSQGAQVEAQREKLYEDILRQTKGEILLPYKRYSTNYTEWSRTDNDWNAWVTDLLSGERSLLAEIGLQRDFIQQMLEQHRNCSKDHRQRLLQLLTLELFLREFF